MDKPTIYQLSAEDLREVVAEVVNEVLSLRHDNTADEEQFFTAKDVTNLLHVDRSTLWRWEKNEYLKPIKVGSKNLYRKSDVQSIMKKSNGL